MCVCVYKRGEYKLVSFLTRPDVALLLRLLHVHRGLPHGVWTKSTTPVQASARRCWKTLLDLFLPYVWSRDWPPECLFEKGRGHWRAPLVEEKRWTEHFLAKSADWIQLWEATPGNPKEISQVMENVPIRFCCSISCYHQECFLLFQGHR